ncbi:hypothetical protein ACFFX0_19905 [Citricoccus parietis]|uniref:Uncharacterized protein n=1 Tax=Citricoccus parietis TaxID=592307 RepID=A0ABV5G3W1_9MICC
MSFLADRGRYPSPATGGPLGPLAMAPFGPRGDLSGRLRREPCQRVCMSCPCTLLGSLVPVLEMMPTAEVSHVCNRNTSSDG